jgi:hypothetical protein
MARFIRTIVENVSVSEVIDAGQYVYPRLGDAFDALKWWLSHSPDSGELIDDMNWLFVQDGDNAVNVPEIVVVYTFDAREVVLKHLKLKTP